MSSPALWQLLFFVLLGIHLLSSPGKSWWGSRFSRRQSDPWTDYTSLHGLPVRVIETLFALCRYLFVRSVRFRTVRFHDLYEFCSWHPLVSFFLYQFLMEFLEVESWQTISLDWFFKRCDCKSSESPPSSFHQNRLFIKITFGTEKISKLCSAVECWFQGGWNSFWSEHFFRRLHQ